MVEMNQTNDTLSQENRLVYKNKMTEQDEFSAFTKVTCQELSQTQIDQIIYPEEIYPTEEVALSMHWHPEFIPFELIRKRLKAMFPQLKRELFIPTQHNVLLSYDGEYSGVEIDCYSPEFDRKVQLLTHFKNDKVKRADVLRSMLKHTFRYRSGQLFEFIDTVLEPAYESRRQEAAQATGADLEVVSFVRQQIGRVKELIRKYESSIPDDMLRNKLLRNYIEEIGPFFDAQLIERAQIYLTRIKQIVKRGFSPKNFFTTQEIIEEVRSLGGGILIPHPEQFWPVLLANYDIDGIEVWNPQSRRYTDFLIDVINESNKKRHKGEKKLLIVMGDDCHMGEKVKEPGKASREKVSRQVGVQPWNDITLRKKLALANTSKSNFIDEYTQRLA